VTLRRCGPFATNNENFLRFLLSLHNQAEAYGPRPSEILGLETDWGAWQLNEITLVVGRRVERNLNEGKDAFDGFSLNGKGKFRSAKDRVKRKIRIPKSGIW
jgi:hypothetical protein